MHKQYTPASIIPFQWRNEKKLIRLPLIEVEDIKSRIRQNFKVSNFKLYNKKIDFEIPDVLLVSYLKQQPDLPNFVIEIVESDNINSEESSVDVKNVSQPSNENNSKRASLNDNSLQKKVKQQIPDNLLKEILDTPEGKQLCNSFDMHYRLTDAQQTLLAKLIVTDEMKKILMSDAPLTINYQRYLDLAAAIVNKFPNEVATTYCYSPLEHLLSIMSGKFINEFYAIKCQYLKNEAETRYGQCGKNMQDDFLELHEFDAIKDNTLEYRAWQQTHDLRMIYLQINEEPLRYITNLIRCLDSKGVKMIEYDFERIHPGKTNMLLDNWDQISERIFTEALVSSRNDVALILDLYGNMPQLSSFMMFSYFLENYQSEVQSFRKENSGNLVIHIDTITGNPMDTFKKYYPEPNKMKPRVFVTGMNAEELRCYVLVGNNLYSTETVVKAVDFCFKFYRILHLPFLPEQNQAWRVIQKAVYDIHTEEDEMLCDQFLNILKVS